MKTTLSMIKPGLTETHTSTISENVETNDLSFKNVRDTITSDVVSNMFSFNVLSLSKINQMYNSTFCEQGNCTLSDQSGRDSSRVSEFLVLD